MDVIIIKKCLPLVMLSQGFLTLGSKNFQYYYNPVIQVQNYFKSQSWSNVYSQIPSPLLLPSSSNDDPADKAERTTIDGYRTVETYPFQRRGLEVVETVVGFEAKIPWLPTVFHFLRADAEFPQSAGYDDAVVDLYGVDYRRQDVAGPGHFQFQNVGTTVRHVDKLRVRCVQHAHIVDADDNVTHAETGIFRGCSSFDGRHYYRFRPMNAKSELARLAFYH